MAKKKKKKRGKPADSGNRLIEEIVARFFAGLAEWPSVPKKP